MSVWPVLSLLPAVLVVAAREGQLPEWILAMATVPALLFVPGAGFARRLSRDPITRALDAVWISALLLVPAVRVGAWSGAGGDGTLLLVTAAALFGALLPAPTARRLHPRHRLASLAALVAVVVVMWSWRGALVRPLDRHWFAEVGQREDWHGDAPAEVVGFARTRVGAAQRLEPRRPALALVGPMEGTVLLLLQGPVGATMDVGVPTTIDADPTENEEEGPVPRYLERGVATYVSTHRLTAGERLPVTLSDPKESVLYVIPSPAALWDLHADGELRFAHYYQLLNMVEQVRWARELYGQRRVTDVQPPLWSYVSAAPLAITGGDLPTQNFVFVGLLAAVGLVGVQCIRAFAPGAPLLAFLLPAAAVGEHAKLMLEPGSAGMPDTLYTLALLGAVAALPQRGPRYALSSLWAQLSRYPGSAVAAIAAVLDGQPARAARMVAGVLAVAAAFGLAGLATGALDGWLETARWETFPEHWHGNTDPAVLVGRVPAFVATWLAYAGGLPLLAALRWPRGTRVALGTALLYGALLATIDHSPSHYFLPLLHLSAVACACTAESFDTPLLRHGLPALGLLGLLASQSFFPVTG